ncbi:5'-nucleotidase [Mycobacteroides abscessus subsp. bolletii]|uniref:HAD-IA family hydrolase n=1 Tax=Mycobacteroides abscessus TaxID=36809 RepID=UPI0009A70E1C|nr:HAD-IA family hydrolase [Mycobacteroides abscessus]SLI86912.1 5'-nucleotidase [Mycobacteroides abscessus subsp. bolletii]
MLVIFDLDGTLTDSAPGIVSSFRHALSHVGAPEPTGDIASRVVGPPMHITLGSMGLGERADDAIAAYRADYSERGWAVNEMFGGIRDVLTRLREAGVPMVVATSKSEPIAARILEHFGLAEFFQVIAGASPDGIRSSKADVIKHALSQLDDVPSTGVVMVGDRVHDVEGAAAHGIGTIVVDWGYGATDFEGDPGELAEWIIGRVSTPEQLLEELRV